MSERVQAAHRWAVCMASRHGWWPLVGTMATNRSDAIALYVDWFDDGMATYRRRQRKGEIRTMRVAVTPIAPPSPTEEP